MWFDQVQVSVGRHKIGKANNFERKLLAVYLYLEFIHSSFVLCTTTIVFLLAPFIHKTIEFCRTDAIEWMNEAFSKNSNKISTNCEQIVLCTPTRNQIAFIGIKKQKKRHQKFKRVSDSSIAIFNPIKVERFKLFGFFFKFPIAIIRYFYGNPSTLGANTN